MTYGTERRRAATNGANTAAALTRATELAGGTHMDASDTVVVQELVLIRA